VRANRTFVPGHIWHITHRCHQKEHLLKFSTDRDYWLKWLFQAKKRFGIKILNYNVTCNHIHLVVTTAQENGGISAAMQLASSRVGQMYNRRKNRKGAFWEDRYHATAIGSKTSTMLPETPSMNGYTFLKTKKLKTVSRPRA